MEPKTLESQIKCHTERFPQWLISLSEKKSNKLCFSLFLLLDPMLRSLQSQGEPSTAVCRKPLCSGALCSVPGCSRLQRAREDNRKTSMPTGTSYRCGGDFHFTFHCTLFWGSKAFAVQFFALQSALLGDFRTKRVAHSLSWKVSRVRKGTEDTTGRGKASWWAWIASLIWFGFILVCGLGNVLTGYSNARIR